MMLFTEYSEDKVLSKDIDTLPDYSRIREELDRLKELLPDLEFGKDYIVSGGFARRAYFGYFDKYKEYDIDVFFVDESCWEYARKRYEFGTELYDEFDKIKRTPALVELKKGNLVVQMIAGNFFGHGPRNEQLKSNWKNFCFLHSFFSLDDKKVYTTYKSIRSEMDKEFYGNAEFPYKFDCSSITSHVLKYHKKYDYNLNYYSLKSMYSRNQKADKHPLSY